MSKKATSASPEPEQEPPKKPEKTSNHETKQKEVGGPSGPEPTRYGDWERKGRCIDF